MNTLIKITEGKNGQALLSMTRQMFLKESEVATTAVDPDFYNDKRKKVLFIADGSSVSIDRKYSKRSTDINRCDAIVMHFCETQKDRDKYISEVAPVTKEQLKNIFHDRHIQYLTAEQYLLGDLFLIKTPQSDSSAIDCGYRLNYEPVYIGQDFGDIANSDIPVFTDKMLTAYQNRFGLVLDAYTCKNIINLLNTNDADNIKMAAMNLMYSNVDDINSIKCMQYIITRYRTIRNALGRDKNGKALMNAINLDIDSISSYRTTLVNVCGWTSNEIDDFEKELSEYE